MVDIQGCGQSSLGIDMRSRERQDEVQAEQGWMPFFLPVLTFKVSYCMFKNVRISLTGLFCSKLELKQSKFLCVKAF